MALVRERINMQSNVY